MTDKCFELDGCCYTHGPCFWDEEDDQGRVIECQGWPCPVTENA